MCQKRPDIIARAIWTTATGAAQCGLLVWLIWPAPLLAQPSNGRLSNAEKCAIYRAAFERIMTRPAQPSLSASFVEENNTFIANGCVDTAFVCPRNAADLAAANALTVATMNRGMASTFVPFKCPQN